MSESVEIMPDATLLARLRQHAEHRPDAIAYRLRSAGALTYRQLADQAAALADWLMERIPRGSTVILSCPGDLHYPGAFLGILTAGCAVFPVSPEASDVELLRAASESEAVCIVGDERSIRLLTESGRMLSRHTHEESPRTNSPDDALRRLERSSGDLLLQSSGTTGLPKIARRTGDSLDSVARATAEAIGFTMNDRVLMTIPLAHSYGLEHGLLAPIWAGSCVHLCPGLDLQILLPELADGITIFPGVPSTFEMLAGLHGEASMMPMLRSAYSAGAPLPQSVFETFLAKYNVRITQLYGATEIGSVAFNSPADPFDSASVGRAMRGVSIRIVDLEGHGGLLSAGNEGQIAIHAPSMFSGYLNGSSDLIDGHFLTGDLGRLDESGCLFVTGRLKLLIDVGGMKVNPLEVEAVLQQHPAVAACVVIAVRQTATINRLKAIIEPRDSSHPPSIETLRQLARDHLSAYKVPRFFEICSDLQRSSNGKIRRHLLELK